MPRRSRQAEYQTGGESYADAAQKSQDAAKILSAGTDTVTTNATATATATCTTRSASTGSLRAHRFPSPRTRYGSHTAHEGSTMVVLSPTTTTTTTNTVTSSTTCNTVARRHSLLGSSTSNNVTAVLVSPTAALPATLSPTTLLTSTAGNPMVSGGGGGGGDVARVVVSPTRAGLVRGVESATSHSTLAVSSPMGYGGSPVLPTRELTTSHPYSTDSASERAYSMGSPVMHYPASLSHGPGSTVSVGEPHGVTVIYPRTGEQLRQGVEEQYEATSEANMDLAEVPVEGYYAQNLDVLIPNDLPRSTLLYVLTASDGRDLMFKLIQYTLQLTICFLKTPTLFSPEALAFTGPWAERFYRNYNTIRHGRSLFKMGRGLLNIFTLQTVCERLGLRYRERLGSLLRLLLRPWLLVFALPLLQLGKATGLTSAHTLQALTEYTFPSSSSATAEGKVAMEDSDNNNNNNITTRYSNPVTTTTSPTTTNAADDAKKGWANTGKTKPRDDQLLTEDMYIHVTTVEAESCTPEYRLSLPWLSVQRPREEGATTAAAGGPIGRVHEAAMTQSVRPTMLSPLPQGASITKAEMSGDAMGAHYGDTRRGWEPLSWSTDDPLAPQNTGAAAAAVSTAAQGKGEAKVAAATSRAETKRSAAATTRTSTNNYNNGSNSNVWLTPGAELHASPLRQRTSSSDLLGCTSDFSPNHSTHDTVPSTFTDGPPQVTFTLPTNADSTSAGLLGESRASESSVRRSTTATTATTTTAAAATALTAGVATEGSAGELSSKEAAQAGTAAQGTQLAAPKPPTLLLQPLKDQPHRAGSADPPEAAHSSSTEDYPNDSFAPLDHAMGGMGANNINNNNNTTTNSSNTSLLVQAATLPAHASPPSQTLAATQATLPEIPDAAHTESAQTTAAVALPSDSAAAAQRLNALLEGEDFAQTRAVAGGADTNAMDELPADAHLEAYDGSEVSVLSHVSSTSDLMQHAELIPAAAAEPGRWRKGPLNYNPLLMVLLGVRSAAAGCRRFLRDATLVSTEQFIRVDVIERHRRPLTRHINRLWLIVAVIDLLLNTVRLLHPGWVRYAMARHDLRCACGCKATEDREDTIVQQGTYFARLKKDLFFPPLNLDYGAPIPSTIAYFEAAEPSRMLPACSRCGFLYKEPGSFPLTTATAAGGGGPQAGRSPVIPPTSPASLAAGAASHAASAATPTYLLPPSASAHEKAELPGAVGTASGHHGGASYVTAADYTYTTQPAKSAAESSHVHNLLEAAHTTALTNNNSSNNDGGNNALGSHALALELLAQPNAQHALTLREKDAHGVERVGIMFIPWLLRKVFDYVWLLRNHANFRATVLLEIRYAAELFLAYTYCFTNYETGKADAPLARILNPYCALAGIVTAAVGLMRVVESAPK